MGLWSPHPLHLSALCAAVLTHQVEEIRAARVVAEGPVRVAPGETERSVETLETRPTRVMRRQMADETVFGLFGLLLLRRVSGDKAALCQWAESYTTSPTLQERRTDRQNRHHPLLLDPPPAELQVLHRSPLYRRQLDDPVQPNAHQLLLCGELEPLGCVIVSSCAPCQSNLSPLP